MTATAEATAPTTVTTRPPVIDCDVHNVVPAVSALFPFKPTLDAMDAALNDAGGMAGAVAHLAALTLGFGALARLALRRFA